MKVNQDKKRTLHFEVNKPKEQIRLEIASSLSPEERLLKLTQLISFAKQFSKNYHNAFQKRLKEGNAFILK